MVYFFQAYPSLGYELIMAAADYCNAPSSMRTDEKMLEIQARDIDQELCFFRLDSVDSLSSIEYLALVKMMLLSRMMGI